MEVDYVFILDEEFNEIIKFCGCEDFSYVLFSEGEKVWIDIVFLFIWCDIVFIVFGVSISILIFDEVFDGLFDVEGIKGVVNIINLMKNINVFIILYKDYDL